MKKIYNRFINSKFYKTHHQEMYFAIIVSVGLYFINRLIQDISPHSAIFDFWSEVETIMFKIGTVIFVYVAAILLYRLAVPMMYRYFRDKIYLGFDTLPPEKQEKYAVGALVIILISVFMSFKVMGSNPNEIRSQLVIALDKQLDIRETKPNRGPMVDKYLLSVNTQPPQPWCAAFVSWNLQQYGVPNPMSAYSPNYAQKKDIVWTPKNQKIKLLPCDVFTLYYSSLGRVGHTGFYLSTDMEGYFICEAGNTNGAGSREGEGVYKKKMSPSKIHAITRYIK